MAIGGMDETVADVTGLGIAAVLTELRGGMREAKDVELHADAVRAKAIKDAVAKAVLVLKTPPTSVGRCP